MPERTLDILVQIQAQTQDAQRVTAALKGVSQEAQQAGKQLERAFTPRLIQSQQQLQQQLFQGARAFQAFVSEVAKSTNITEAARQKAGALAQEMIRLSTATNITVKELQALAQQAANLGTSNEALRAGTSQIATSFNAMTPALQKVNREMGSFTPNATNAQKAGQGLILSFSLSQLAAGNFAQSMFGLGFSLLFVGPQMLNVVTMATALSAAFAGIAIEKLTAHFKNETVPILQEVSEKMKDIRDSIAEVRGENEEFVRSFQQLAEAEGSVDSLAGVAKRLADHYADAGKMAERAAKQFAGGDFERAVSILVLMGVGLGDARTLVRELGEEGSLSVDELKQAFIEASAEAAGLTQEGVNAAIAISRSFQQTVTDINATAAAFRQGIADQAAAEAVTAPFDAEIAAIREKFAIQRELESQAASGGGAGASRARQERIRLLRRALEDELNTQRDHIDRVKDVLSKRIDVIKEASALEVRIIRERAENVVFANRRALQDSLDDMKDATDARIGAVKDAADRELDINKERIQALKDQERSLADALRELTRRRQEGIRDILQTEEEIAELEALRRRQGADPSLELELALREARLRALNEEQAAIEDQTDSTEDQIKAVDDLIDKTEDRADQIKRNRDAAIDAIKDELQEAQKAARRRSEDEIRAINRTRDADIRAANDAADRRVDAERRAADRRIEQIEAVMQRQRRASQDQIAGIQAVSAASSGANSKRLRELRAIEQAEIDLIEAQRKQARQAFELAQLYKNEIIPALVEAIRAKGGALLDIINLAKAAGASPDVLQDLAEKFIPPGADPFFIPELQTGGRVPGSVGQPQLAVLHGGEQVESGMVAKHGRAGVSAAGVLTVILEATGQSMSPSELRKLKSVLNRSFGNDIEVHLRSRRLMAS